jgi:meso-butanediol dehydrogenase/(S,S)-butanediol dehydrogenase/diacetyl reductase
MAVQDGLHAGKGVVITGGASGIGRGCAERFIRDGARVLVIDRDKAGLDALAADHSDAVIPFVADVTDEAQLDAAFDAAVDAFGGIDVCVNNAGIIFVAPLIDTRADEWRRILDVNVVGIALASRAAARRMIEGGRGGVIINASSGGGRHGVANFSQYCASKAAVLMMSQSFAQELAPHRIRVNVYTPGHIMTPFWEQIVGQMGERLGLSREQTLDAFLAEIPWGRFGTPEDVAAAVSWLASDDAEFVSGQAIAMNGAELPW